MKEKTKFEMPDFAKPALIKETKTYSIPVKTSKQKKNKFQTAIEMLVEEQEKSIRLGDELKRTKEEVNSLQTKTKEFLADFAKAVDVLGKLGEKLKEKKNE